MAKETPKSSLGVIFFQSNLGLMQNFAQEKNVLYTWGKICGQGFPQNASLTS
jgi:hypothetical protein